MSYAGAEALGKALGYKPLWHILNSAGIERFPQYQFDMVRLGIGIYGISALPNVRLAPVASLKVKILQIKELKASDGTIGNICMDMCMLDVTGIPCSVGDTVTIFGTDPTITELADILGTIPYEILTSVPRWIERVIVRK